MAENPSTTKLVFEAIRAELRPPAPAAMICLTRTQARAALEERDDLLEALKAAQDMAINAREPFGSPRYVGNNDPRWVQIADAIAKAEGR